MHRAAGSTQRTKSKSTTKPQQKKALTTQKRKVSYNKAKNFVNTKKRLMLEVPTTPDINEAKQLTAMTAFDIETEAVSFTHPLPSLDLPEHPLQPKPKLTGNQMFAIIDVNGSQHKVTKDDQIMVNHLRDVEVGEKLAFDHVYLLAGRDFSVLGKPWVPDVSVVAVVEEHTLLAPQTTWKHKRRTGYRNLNRSRDHVTILRIEDLIVDNPELIPQVKPLDQIMLNVMKPNAELQINAV